MSSPLEAPQNFKKDVNVWIDEAIWGHRFYNDQTPWLVLLEFLAIFRDRYRVGKALNESRTGNAHESFTYHIPRLIPVRQLIFNNPFIQHIESTIHNDNDRWLKLKEHQDLDYLRNRFSVFAHLIRIIEFFQNTAVETHRLRRWSSHFLFPYGPDCLYADLPKNITASPDRRFFARGGELLYLMLTRGSKESNLSEMIASKLLCRNNDWNQVVKTFHPPDHNLNSESTSSAIGYLPYADRREYFALAKTWERLLKLDLPSVALLDPLMRLSALHMLLYMLRRSNEEIDGVPSEPKFVLEIAAPRKTALFEISVENLVANRALSTRAVRAHVNNAKNDNQWNEALRAFDPVAASRKYLLDRFAWEPDDCQSTRNPEAIFESLLAYAVKRHKQHVAKVHLEWTRQIGLTVSRRGTGTWYAPNDSLLKALVMCIVDDREEYHLFLAKLYDRFCIVVSAPEAESAFSKLPTDKNAFDQNTQRLEHRLRALGLLHRLSDDCAYVTNPFLKQS